MSTSPHLSADDVAAFVDRTMPDDERADSERHLAECDACREEVVSVTRLVTTAQTQSGRRLSWPVIVPLAAALLLAVVLRGRAGPSGEAPPQERGAPSEGSRIRIVAPTADAPFTDASRTFTWHAIEGSIGYRVVIKDASGGIVWSADVADTTVRAPASSGLRAGESYVWRVDGQRADGTTAASAETSFRVSP